MNLSIHSGRISAVFPGYELTILELKQYFSPGINTAVAGETQVLARVMVDWLPIPSDLEISSIMQTLNDAPGRYSQRIKFRVSEGNLLELEVNQSFAFQNWVEIRDNFIFDDSMLRVAWQMCFERTK
jgi:hypothetical protein